MPWRRFGGVVIGLAFTIGVGSAATTAHAQDAPPESPPPAFVAPPPGYEPPTQYAQGAPAAAPAAPEALPTLLTLDRMDPTSRFGVQIGLDKLDAQSLSDVFIQRFEPYGQYVFPNGQVGIYGQLPIAHVIQSNRADATGVGNIDLGTFFLPLRTADLILRAGLAMSTATKTGDGEAANVVAGIERFTDFVLIAPSYTTLRLSASTVQQSGMAFFRGDFGFDIAIDKPSSGDSVYLRANAAAGIRFPDVDLSAELVNWGDPNGSGSLASRFYHTFSVSLRTRGPNQLHIGSVFPLDDVFRGNVWIVSLGYQRAVTL
jgi:hypothetical protein